MNAHPNQYQFCTFDKHGELIHAGVSGAARISKQAIIKHERDWLQWRADYIKENPGNYPLKTVKPPALAYMESLAGNGKDRLWIEL